MVLLMRRLLVGAALLTASFVVSTASGASTRAASAKVDARWTTLQTCLTNAEHSVLRQVIHLNGSVRTTSPGHLRVFAPDGWVAAVTYQGTFAQAKSQAKQTKQTLRPPTPPGTGAPFAIGNVTYYFTTFVSSTQVEVVTGCLTKTYAGQPKWPANLDPNSLANSGHPWPPEP
jgi:hypothetical protein